MEVFFPVFRLLEEGWQVDITAPDVKEITGENGYVLKPDKTIEEVDPENTIFLYSGRSSEWSAGNRAQN